MEQASQARFFEDDHLFHLKNMLDEGKKDSHVEMNFQAGYQFLKVFLFSIKSFELKSPGLESDMFV